MSPFCWQRLVSERKLICATFTLLDSPTSLLYSTSCFLVCSRFYHTCSTTRIFNEPFIADQALTAIGPCCSRSSLLPPIHRIGHSTVEPCDGWLSIASRQHPLIMADPAVLIKLHEKARLTVHPSTPPETLLNKAAGFAVITHDAFIAGRLARAYYAWAKAEACLQQISRQAKNHAPNTPLPFCNSNWAKAWTSVHQGHQGQRKKIDDIEARLDATDLQNVEDWDIDVNPPPTPTPLDVIIEENAPQIRLETCEPGSQDDTAGEGQAGVPRESLLALEEHFPLITEQLNSIQLRLVWENWQAVAPPEDISTYDLTNEHSEVIAVIQDAQEKMQALYNSTKPLSVATDVKGKGKAVVDGNPGLDRIPSATPPSIFSADGRLSVQSRTSVESNNRASIITAGSRETNQDEESQQARKSRWPKLSRPLNKLVRRSTRQSTGSAKGKRVSIFSTAATMKECSSCFDEYPNAVR